MDPNLVKGALKFSEFEDIVLGETICTLGFTSFFIKAFVNSITV